MSTMFHPVIGAFQVVGAPFLKCSEFVSSFAQHAIAACGFACSTTVDKPADLLHLHV